jgi:glutamyl-tRNA(Gln) amidotransferase subunit E
LAFQGVPNETRKALQDGTTLFERVLPGPDRMYPDTDSAPIAITDQQIQSVRKILPDDVANYFKQLKSWKIPQDTYTFILKRNLFSLIKNIIEDFGINPVFVGTLIGQRLKNLEGRIQPATPFNYQKIHQLCGFVSKKGLEPEILKPMLTVLYQYPNMDFDSILTTIGFRRVKEREIMDHIEDLKKKFNEIKVSKTPTAKSLWIMGQLYPLAVGNMKLKLLRKKISGGAS